MRSLNRYALAVAVFVGSVPLTANAGFQRTIQYSANRTIVEQLTADDDVVTIDRIYDYSIVVPKPNGSEIVQGLLQDDHITAAIVDVAGVRGLPVDDGRWIRTFFEGKIVEILHRRRSNKYGPSLQTGGTVTFSSDGGELRIGKVTVNTMNRMSFPEHGLYLVFLGLPLEGGDSRGADAVPLLIQGNQLISPPESKSEIATLTLDQVRQITRRRQ